VNVHPQSGVRSGRPGSVGRHPLGLPGAFARRNGWSSARLGAVEPARAYALGDPPARAEPSSDTAADAGDVVDAALARLSRREPGPTHNRAVPPQMVPAAYWAQLHDLSVCEGRTVGPRRPACANERSTTALRARSGASGCNRSWCRTSLTPGRRAGGAEARRCWRPSASSWSPRRDSAAVKPPGALAGLDEERAGALLTTCRRARQQAGATRSTGFATPAGPRRCTEAPGTIRSAPRGAGTCSTRLDETDYGRCARRPVVRRWNAAKTRAPLRARLRSTPRAHPSSVADGRIPRLRRFPHYDEGRGRHAGPGERIVGPAGFPLHFQPGSMRGLRGTLLDAHLSPYLHSLPTVHANLITTISSSCGALLGAQTRPIHTTRELCCSIQRGVCGWRNFQPRRAGPGDGIPWCRTEASPAVEEPWTCSRVKTAPRVSTPSTNAPSASRVLSGPYDVCLAYDPSLRTAREMRLQYHSVGGKLSRPRDNCSEACRLASIALFACAHVVPRRRAPPASKSGPVTKFFSVSLPVGRRHLQVSREETRVGLGRGDRSQLLRPAKPSTPQQCREHAPPAFRREDAPATNTVSTDLRVIRARPIRRRDLELHHRAPPRPWPTDGLLRPQRDCLVLTSPGKG